MNAIGAEGTFALVSPTAAPDPKRTFAAAQKAQALPYITLANSALLTMLRHPPGAMRAGRPLLGR